MKQHFLSTLVLGLTFVAVTAKNIPLRQYPRSLSKKIVGGRPALPGEVPYQLEILDLDLYWQVCGASLVEVSGIHVGLTAAHCVGPGAAGSIALVAGVLNTSNPSGMEQEQIVVKVVVHEDYDYSDMRNDIAILFVPELYNLTERVATIRLPAKDQQTLNGSLTVSGWGDLEFLGNAAQHLQIVELPIVDTQNCMDLYGLENDTVVCAGTDKADNGPCQGDSGGPARSEEGYLAGIVSYPFGTACGESEGPGVFTRVSAYIDWIEKSVESFKQEETPNY